MEDEYDDPFETMDEDDIQKYNQEYLDEINRSGSGLEEHVKDEIFRELQSRHNLRRSGDGSSDARRNFLEASNVINQQEKNTDPHLKTLMEQIDKRKGEPGASKKMLKEGEDSAYFAQLRREGKIK